ncbi:MAG: hypothetical protein GF418_04935 [Chitinivibrionales bacterium]|nr:hypothetical protein [Chitinivibrionales bacterium]MBD3394954.1 hypothetical protein [Chitinivibrionales bacterium]
MAFPERLRAALAFLRRRDALFSILICLAGLALVVAWHAPFLAPSNDGDAYLMYAKSLSQGSGYRDLLLPGEPIAVWWPAGWPFILSFVYRVAGFHHLPYHILMSLLFLGTGIVLYHLARMYFSAWPSFLVAYSFIAHAIMSQQTRTVLTEIPFSFFLYGGLLLFAYGEQKKSDMLCVTAMASIVFCTFLKFYGEVLLPALALALLVKRRWKLLGILCLLIALKVGIQFGVHGPDLLHRGKTLRQPGVRELAAGREATDAAQSFFQRNAPNVRRMLVTLIPREVFPSLYHVHPMGRLKMLVCLLVTLGVFAGMVLGLNKGMLFPVLTLGAMLAGLLTRGNGPYIYRYYAPVSPLITLFLLVTAREAFRRIRWRPRWERIALGILWALSFALVADKTVFNGRRLAEIDTPRAGSAVHDFNDVCECIQERTANDALLLSPTPAPIYIRTGRKTLYLKWGEKWEHSWSDKKLAAYAAQVEGQNIDYLVLQNSWLALTDFDLEGFEEELSLVFPEGVEKVCYGSPEPVCVYEIPSPGSRLDSCGPLRACFERQAAARPGSSPAPSPAVTCEAIAAAAEPDNADTSASPRAP